MGLISVIVPSDGHLEFLVPRPLPEGTTAATRDFPTIALGKL